MVLYAAVAPDGAHGYHGFTIVVLTLDMVPVIVKGIAAIANARALVLPSIPAAVPVNTP